VNGEADHSAGNADPLEQAIAAEAGKTYLLTFTVKNCTTGAVYPQIGGTNGVTRAVNGTYTDVIIAVGAFNLKFFPTLDFDGSLDDVSVKEASGIGTVFYPEHVGSYWRMKHAATWGYAEVTEYISGVEVRATVKSNFGGTGNVTVWREGAWSDYRGWPSCITFYENRLFFACTRFQPQTIWASKTGDYYNFTPGSADDDPLTFTINSDQVNEIKWLAPQKVLLLGTGRGQWHISSSGASGVLTPADVKSSRETNLTSSPVFSNCDHTVLFWQRFGRRLIEVAYSLESDTYQGVDLSILAEHMGQSPVRQMVYMQEPLGLVLATREDGQLVTMTYERAHKVVAWTRWPTQGSWESLILVPGVDREEIWVVAKRTVDGSEKRYIEYFENLENYEGSTEDMHYVDSGLVYDGLPTFTITGLLHLKGLNVAVLADGTVHQNRTVSETGTITLSRQASKVHVGLPFESIAIPVRSELQLPGGTSQGRQRRVVILVVRLYRTYGARVGELETKMDVVPFRKPGDLMDSPLVMFTGDTPDIPFPGSFGRDGKLIIKQDLPLPQNILSLMPYLEIEP
jgi:hypothetical protein